MLKNTQELRTVHWITHVFKPIVDEIDVCSLKADDQKCIVLSDYPIFIRYGLERCIVLVKYTDKLPYNSHGVCITSYKKEENIFLFQIALNKTLSDDALCIKRKEVFIHEILHLIAALLSLARIRSAELMKKLREKLKEKVTLITEETLANLREIMEKKASGNNNPIPDFDTHYRLGWEDFPASYSTLFEELMLSKKEFELVFTEEKQAEFKKNIQNKEVLLLLLTKAFSEIASLYHIDYEFVCIRFFKVFINEYVNG